MFVLHFNCLHYYSKLHLLYTYEFFLETNNLLNNIFLPEYRLLFRKFNYIINSLIIASYLRVKPYCTVTYCKQFLKHVLFIHYIYYSFRFFSLNFKISTITSIHYKFIQISMFMLILDIGFKRHSVVDYYPLVKLELQN